MKQSSPAAVRNRDPILEVLRRVAPSSGLVLEIASGTGEHVVHFAAGLPALTFQPSDVSEVALESVRAHVAEAALDNLRVPLALDVTQESWPVESAALILCSNMIHISPWAATEGLMRGAGSVLKPGSALVTYGPYRFHGEYTAPSNAAFHESLRSRDPAWGVRDVDEIVPCAAAQGLAHEETIALPANNHVLLFRKVAAT